ncbi:SusC/RagA family TonB-linked outer membrane protein [Gracilimonas mengyeensis]|uniref:TonB-linked outer membrane protein, SusC/RagA family n=1 Tax=Gracilimonas mengyeensis TaxID=1302730 RepID=A0A521FFJ5_9BACT|nr:TonB-dependent receptor [Gracilimonas mengyeensis]SMO94953.1 TonB-linked outer membrane protein, SusC/RagA family [Gracilimonas mengyeensis]
MKKLLLYCSSLVLLFFVSTGFTYAQTVSGTVISADDESPIPGVTILLQGTNKGTATNIDGEYEIELTDSEFENGILVFSAVGFMEQQVSVNGRSTIDIELATDTQLLDEVVVTGYGSQIKEKVTGNIASVSSEDFETVSLNSFEEAIQGRASGVFVQADNGKLGGGITVRVRGTASVNASSQPLYVVDGIPVNTTDLSSNGSPTNPLADLNPNDIESIEILKDASASAIYGSRASNGVVLITTKSGRSGDAQFNVDYSLSTRTPTNHKEFLNGQQYYDLFDEARANVGITTPIDAYFDVYLGGVWDPENNVDWEDQAYQDNLSQSLEISTSGGNDQTQYFISGAFDDQEGHIIGDTFNRINGRVNLDHQFTDRFDIGVNMALTRTLNERIPNDNSFATPIQLAAQSPLTPVYTEDGTLNMNTLYNNGLLYLDGTNYDTEVYRTLGKAFARFEITPKIRVQGEFGLDLLDQQEKAWYGSSVFQFTGANNGSAFLSNDRIRTMISQAYLEYNDTYGSDHSLDAVVGTSYENTLQEFNSVSAEDFPNDDFTQISSATTVTAGTGGETEYSFVGYFARANYSFKDTYLLTLSGRVDGSSRFGEDNRYGFFPAVSAGWILSNEDFLDVESLSFLKLRASAGVTGNAAIGNFSSRNLYGAAGYAGRSALEPDQTPNPALKWETATQYNLGVDFGLFSDRVSGEVDVYLKKSEDLLLDVNIPITSGFTEQTRNVGSLENKGFEFVVNSINTVGAFKWNTTFNFSINRNEITNIDGQVISDGRNRAIEGEPIGVFYALEWAGADPENGDGLYYVNSPEGKDHSTGTTNNPNAANQVVIGNPNPDFIGGITNSFAYKGFDLSLFFQFVYGNEIYNGGGVYQACSACYFDNQTLDQYEDRWQEPGDVTDVPQARLFDFNGSAQSSRYLSDGSYLRLKNLSFGYTLPSSLSEKLSINRARIYFTGVNLLTFTDYDGWDPEVNTDINDGNIAIGEDFYSAPQAKIYTFGISLGF